MSALIALLVALVLAGPAYGAVPSAVGGRAFTVAAWDNIDPWNPLAVGPDGTFWAIDLDGLLWRQRPSELQPSRVFTGHRWSDVAAAHDGSVLLAAQSAVWRRAPDGALAIAAGGGRAAVEGGPAAGTSICDVRAVADLPDGGFVFSDRGGHAVRRVGADGTISTLYATTPEDRAYGCPAAPASGREATDLAGARDGSVLLVVSVPLAPKGSIVRIAPSGAETTLVSLVNLESIAAAPDGSIWLTQGGAVRRLAPGARRPETILPEGVKTEYPPPFARDGERAADFVGFWFEHVAATADGGLIAAGSSDFTESGTSIVYLAPPAPARLAVAMDVIHGRATTRGYAVAYRATRPGRAALAVLDARGNVVARVAKHARRGLNRIELRRSLPSADYTVRLTATGTGRQIARHAARLYLGGVLLVDDARTLLVPESIDFGGGCSNCDPDEHPTRFEGCRRIGARRVDCRYSYRDGQDEPACKIGSARLSVAGVVRTDTSDCPSKRPAIRAWADRGCAGLCEADRAGFEPAMEL